MLCYKIWFFVAYEILGKITSARRSNVHVSSPSRWRIESERIQGVQRASAWTAWIEQNLSSSLFASKQRWWAWMVSLGGPAKHYRFIGRTRHANSTRSRCLNLINYYWIIILFKIGSKPQNFEENSFNHFLFELNRRVTLAFPLALLPRTPNVLKPRTHKICDNKNFGFGGPKFVQIWRFWCFWKAEIEIYPNLAKLNWSKIQNFDFC